nr:tetratricopeptide repeat protein [Vibrio ponticus]
MKRFTIRKVALMLTLVSAAPTFAQTSAETGTQISAQANNGSLSSTQAGSPVAQAPNTSTSQSLSQHIADLSYQAQDKTLDSAQRAKALRELAQYPSQNALVAVARGLKDQDAKIREAAVIAAEPYGIEYRWRLLSPLLDDANHSVRVTSAANLVRDYQQLEPVQQQQMNRPIAELIDYLKLQQESSSRLLLADVYRWQGQWQQADIIYQALLAKLPDNRQIWLSLADNYRAQEQDKAALETLNIAIHRVPANALGNAPLHYSKALTLVRLERPEEAAQEMAIAASSAKDNSYYWYLNGVLQEPINVKTATSSFEKAYLISGAPEQLYALCDIYLRHDNAKGAQCLAELEKIAPPYVIEELKGKGS